jgi:hypothetical protein
LTLTVTERAHHRVIVHTSKHHHDVAVVVYNQHFTRDWHFDGLMGRNQRAGGTLQASKRLADTGIEYSYAVFMANAQKKDFFMRPS